MAVDAGEAGLNAMRRALAEVEKKEVIPPRAAPTDIRPAYRYLDRLPGRGASLSEKAPPLLSSAS